MNSATTVDSTCESQVSFAWGPRRVPAEVRQHSESSSDGSTSTNYMPTARSWPSSRTPEEVSQRSSETAPSAGSSLSRTQRVSSHSGCTGVTTSGAPFLDAPFSSGTGLIQPIFTNADDVMSVNCTSGNATGPGGESTQLTMHTTIASAMQPGSARWCTNDRTSRSI